MLLDGSWMITFGPEDDEVSDMNSVSDDGDMAAMFSKGHKHE